MNPITTPGAYTISTGPDAAAPNAAIVVLDPEPCWAIGPDGRPTRTEAYTGLLAAAERDAATWQPRLVAQLRVAVA